MVARLEVRERNSANRPRAVYSSWCTAGAGLRPTRRSPAAGALLDRAERVLSEALPRPDGGCE
eukprot:3060744-Lingulodinium_polyedra.AAC.1